MLTSALRLDLARRRDDRLQIPLLHGFDVDRDARLPLELQFANTIRREDHDDPDADQNFLVTAHAPPRLFSSAIPSAITA
jgi:hypothetical protein